ncbi:MAG: hypothetical protein DSZ24_01895 [Thermodesulfatator sp.]|nr:MAG: hypothetical protein DSZ24_01895 [Thermodesulfatator sp.]
MDYVLDAYYLPTRYPDGLPRVHLLSYYQAEEAIRYAGEILEFVHAKMAPRRKKSGKDFWKSSKGTAGIARPKGLEPWR